jgi:RNA polymerase sigma-70 factor, ECF subfamily
VVSGDRDIATVIAQTFRDEWPRLVAVTMRLVGDLATAEDIAQDVLVAALDRWPLTGMPDRPAAWLMTACRNRALNVLRDTGRAQDRLRSLVPLLTVDSGQVDGEASAISDDRLRLVFICCHPVLPVDGQVALTLRMLGGLSTREIAHAFHVEEATIAQRIVRAKRSLAQAQVPFEEPVAEELAARLPAVLDVVYLIFNEGYLASTGTQLTRPLIASEAHRLARLLTDLLPGQPEVWGLRALIAFHRSRDDARVDDAGRLLTLESQDRTRWDRSLIAEGVDALARAQPHDASGPMVLQARIAARHATAASFADTDWAGIIDCYDQILARNNNPVVALNRAVAVTMACGPEAALPLLDKLAKDVLLARAHRVWAVRADLHRRLGHHRRALRDYDRALNLVDNDLERDYLTGMRAASVGALSRHGTPNSEFR